MDEADASLEVINLICATLLFIHDVIKESSESTLILATLTQHHRFLDSFADLCFSDVTGILRDARVPIALVSDVQRSLHSLNKTLAAHREAWRYMGAASDIKQQQSIRRSTISPDAGDQKKKWREQIRQRSQIWEERVGPAVHLTLFEKEEIDSLVSACNAWTNRLRHTLLIILLIADDPSPHFPTTEQTTHLGITHMVERQRRLGLKPSENYRSLTGQLRKSVSAAQPHIPIAKTVYNDGYEEIDVIVEIRPYIDAPTGSVRQLAWYLSASITSPTTTKQHRTLDEYDMLSLSCMGYIDDPGNTRSLILYRSPQSHPWASSPPSLYDAISKGRQYKLSLTRRFKVARTLAASVLDIHTSGFLHNNINSRIIAMMPHQLNDIEPSPYLLGWGVEPVRKDGHMALEPNLHRHHIQLGHCSFSSARIHDIYSLGVVLLEIGLWTTMSTVFLKLLETSPQFTASEEKAIFKKVNRVILDLAHSQDVRREMGERYARLVQECLEWPRQDDAESMLRFRKEVVDVLEMGRLL